MKEQYPLWLLLHLSPDFSAENGNEGVPIRDYFRIQPCTPPPTGVFRKYVFVGENFRPSCPSSRLYWPPLQKLLTIPFRYDFIGSFFVCAFLTSSAIWKTKKLPVRTRCQPSFIFGNWRSTMQEQTPWWHRVKKTRDRFLCSLQIKIKARQARCSTSGYVWTTWSRQNSHLAVASQNQITLVPNLELLLRGQTAFMTCVSWMLTPSPNSPRPHRSARRPPRRKISGGTTTPS